MSGARRQALEILAATVGAEFYDLGGPGGLVGGAYTPAGLVWKASGVHTLVISFGSDRDAGWRALLEDLRAGVEACEDPDCDVCQAT